MKMEPQNYRKLSPRVFLKVNKVSSAEMSRNSSINKSFKLLKFHFACNVGFNYFLLCSNKYSQESDSRSIEKSL